MLNHRALREQVYEYLRDEMHAGRIAPNTTLNLNAISERLGISKTPLRDALIKLEVEGFVTIKQRRGVIVNGLSVKEVRNFYQIIGALEGDVVKEVFDRLDATHVRKMRQITEEMRQALRQDTFGAYYEANIRFHDVFLNLTANDALRPLIMPMKQRLYDFQMHPYVKDWEFRNCTEHDQIVHKIEQGDKMGAVHTLRDVHWSYQVQESYILEYYHFREQERLRESQGRP